MRPRRLGADDLTATKQATLHEAVHGLVERGMNDPVAIVTQLSEEYGQSWLLRQLVNIVQMIALGSPVAGQRHHGSPSELVRINGLPRVQRAVGAEFFEEMRWVSPEDGWKCVADLSERDCLTISDQYGRLIDVAASHQNWFREAAALMRREGADRLADVRTLLNAPTAAPLLLAEGAA